MRFLVLCDPDFPLPGFFWEEGSKKTFRSREQTNREDFNQLKETADSAFLGKAAVYGSLSHSFSSFTSLIDFQPAVPVFQPGYANKSTYWKGGLGASGFHQLPTLPGEQVGPVEPQAKARRQAEHFKVCGASSS